jgi:hypothetical protein
LALLVIGFEGSDASYAHSFERHLSARGVRAERRDKALTVSAGSFADCDLLGEAIADFVEQQADSRPFHAEGPGGDSTLYRLGTDEDAAVISGLLASCAFLQ